MKAKLFGIVLNAVVLVASAAQAQQAPASPADSVKAPTPTTPAPAPAPAPVTPAPTPTSTSGSTFKDRIYYGGSVTLSFGDATRIGIFPMIGYKVTPKLSGGAKIGYEYVNYDNFDQSAHNYGGSVFARYRVIPQLYGHAELQEVNYELFTGPNTSSREWVPFLLLGGGVSQMVAPRTWAYVEVLVDVLQDDQSPYEDWDPVVNVGVGVGF